MKKKPFLKSFSGMTHWEQGRPEKETRISFWRKAAMELIFKEPLNKSHRMRRWQNQDDHRDEGDNLSTMPGSATPRLLMAHQAVAVLFSIPHSGCRKDLNHFSSASLTYR